MSNKVKIHFIKEEALTYLEANVEYNLKNYLSESNDWVSEKYISFKNESPFVELKFEVNDINLEMTSERAETTDYNNVKMIYDGLKNISNIQAADERLWVGLAHGKFYKYMQYRAKLSEKNLDKNKIMNNFFFNKNIRRSLIMHPLARLWWVGRLLYDENRADPYEALEYLRLDFGTKVLTLFSSNFTNNPIITRAILIACEEIEKSGDKLTRVQFNELIRYVNILGGIIILDYLTEEELTEKIKKHFYSFYS